MGEIPAASARQREGVGLAGRAIASAGDALLAEMDRWFLWVPVSFAAGIGLYFSLDNEPGLLPAIAGPVGCLGLTLLCRSHAVAWCLSVAALCAALGFADAKYRSHSLSTPMLGKERVKASVAGWVGHVEPRLPQGHRLTLKIIDNNSAEHIPPLKKVRITSRFPTPPKAGTAISLDAILMAVPEPVAPGGFDFARKAWFSGIGAVGFAISAPEVMPDPPERGVFAKIGARIAGLRQKVDVQIRSEPGDASGAIASALITGERGRIPEPVLQALRHSGLAHMLAISGLHMALMAGTLFWIARAAMCAVPAIALLVPVKKVAAVFALAGGGFYLALSGSGIATQRAFIMMAIMFLAVLLNRPAITLRNVAIAALVVLVLFPESLLDVSFQMSFAAATALVAVYERWTNTASWFAMGSPGPRLLQKSARYLIGIAVTTLVAGIAVAPFAAFHFHKIAQYSLFANLLSMPVLAMVVMPMALVTLLAMPFGLEYWPLQIMHIGIDTIVSVASEISGWEDAVVRVAAMPVGALLILALGGVWLIAWRGRWRFAGLAIGAFCVLIAAGNRQPDILVSRDASAAAVRDHRSAGLSLIRVDGGEYSLERWLQADGDERDLETALENANVACDAAACVGTVRGKRFALVKHASALAEECRRADIVVATFPLGVRCSKPRVKLDRMDVKKTGAQAIWLDGQSIRVKNVAQARGDRPWTRHPIVSESQNNGGEGSAHAAD